MGYTGGLPVGLDALRDSGFPCLGRIQSVPARVRGLKLDEKNWLLFLEPSVEPVEERALPEHAVLRLEHPVVLIGEDEKLGGDAA